MSVFFSVFFNQVAHAEADELTEAMRITFLLPGLFENIGGCHIDIIKSALVLDLFESSWVKQALGHAEIDEVGEMKT